jgi:hypothetical protein
MLLSILPIARTPADAVRLQASGGHLEFSLVWGAEYKRVPESVQGS